MASTSATSTSPEFSSVTLLARGWNRDRYRDRASQAAGAANVDREESRDGDLRRDPRRLRNRPHDRPSQVLLRRETFRRILRVPADRRRTDLAALLRALGATVDPARRG